MSTPFIRTAPKTTDVSDVTQEEITLLRRIKKSVYAGHDIEIRKSPDGTLKVLEVSKRILPSEN
ncbi:MAG: hypothetical protein ACI4WX_09550 [Aristaeellaceae bacterium]